jgi:hypothetical protein
MDHERHGRPRRPAIGAGLIGLVALGGLLRAKRNCHRAAVEGA